MAEQCDMIVGYLVPHRCEHPALGKCRKCGRGFCDEHVQVTSGGLICLACSQGLSQPVALPITAQTFSPADVALFHSATMFDSQDDGDTFSDLS